MLPPAPAKPRTITTQTGEQFTLDFYCSARSAHMTFIGCERMREAAIQRALRPKTSFGTWVQDAPAENPCLKCKQGKAIAAHNHTRKNPGRNRYDTPKGICLWPGCKNKIHASGLCQTHSRAMKRNALIKLNTASAGATAIHEFLHKLVSMAADADMPVEDVALAALDEGVKVYFERKRRSTPAQP